MGKMYGVSLSGRKELFHGIISLRESAGGVVPVRMTEKLLDFYRRVGNDRLTRAMSSAGVRLQFRTAARKMAMEVGLGPFSCACFGFDVSCDGSLVGRFTRNGAEEKFAFEQDLPGSGMRTVTVAFPWQAECTVVSLRLDDVSAVEPVTSSRKPMIMLGDSITQGFEVFAPGESYAARTAEALGREWFNIAVAGATMQGEVAEAAADYPWDTALVAYGVNDCSKQVPLEKFRSESMRCMKALTGREGAKVFVITPLPWPGCPAEQPAELALQKYRDILAECAEIFPQITVIDGTKLLENDLRFFADAVHPNALGMELIASRLIPRLGNIADAI